MFSFHGDFIFLCVCLSLCLYVCESFLSNVSASIVCCKLYAMHIYVYIVMYVINLSLKSPISNYL